MPGPAQADDTNQHPATQHRKKRSKPGDQVEPRGRGRRQHFLTVAGDKRRYDLFFPCTLADLLDDRLLGRHGKATLEVVATVDGQAAATLTSEGLLNLLGGGQGGRRCGAEEKERQRKPTRSLQPSLRRSESVKRKA